MEQKAFHRKLTAILSADEAGYSRLMQDEKAATARLSNLCTESLATLFLKKIPKTDLKKRGVIPVVDAAYPFYACKHDLDKNKNSFEMFKKDPLRIVEIMEERANAYQHMFWDALRT
jgi:hypothetical protein